MKSSKYLFTFIIILSTCCNNVFAGSSAGTTSGDILLVIPSAAASATGGAGTAMINPSDQFLSLNPAHISELDTETVSFSYNYGIESTNQQEIKYVSTANNHIYAVTMNYFSYGETRRTTYNEQTGAYTVTGKFSASDLIVKGALEMPSLYGWKTGLRMKLLQERLDDKVSSALMFDAGCIRQSTTHPFAVGVTFQNVGSKLKFQKDTHTLPLLIRAGVSYQLFNEKVTTCLDLQRIKGQETDILFGAVYVPNDLFSIRAGYDHSNDASEGITFGFDFTIKETISLSYAYIPHNEFNTSHKLTFSLELK